MNKAPIVWLLISAVLLALLVFTCCAEAEPHDPIYINTNTGFTAPESGVRSGTGTENDPYIISDWDIIASSATTGQGGIHIESTDAYFVIRDCTVRDGSATLRNGIYFANVKNGKITDTEISGNNQGISVNPLESMQSSDISIEECMIHENEEEGIYLESSSDIEILDCEAYKNKKVGIHLSGSEECKIINCTSYENRMYDYYKPGNGIHLTDSSNVLIKGCIAYKNEGEGIRFERSNNNEIKDCEVYENIGGGGGDPDPNVDRGGIALSESSENKIENCTCYKNKNGILLLYSSDNNEISGCEAYENRGASNSFVDGNGIFFSASSDNKLSNSVFHNNSGGKGICLTPHYHYTGYQGHSSNNEISNCKSVDNGGGIAIWWTNCGNNNISDNEFIDNSVGIFVGKTETANMFSNNTVKNNRYGIYFDNTCYQTFRDTKISDNSHCNLSIRCVYNEVKYYQHYMDTSNTIDGKPIYYLVDEEDREISDVACAFLYVVNSTNIRVSDLTISGRCTAVMAAFSRDTRISNLTIKNNGNGVLLVGNSENVIIEYSTIENNGNGIGFRRGCGYVIDNNIIKSNSDDGIAINDRSKNNIVTNNRVEENTGYGISMERSSINNTFTSNTVNSNGKGGIRQNDGGTANAPNFYTGNTINSNNGDGFWASAQYDNIKVILTNNKIKWNKGAGIYVERCMRGSSFSNNLVEGNEGSGIYLGRTETDIMNNTIVSNKDCGIFLNRSNRCDIQNNTIRENNQYGILLSDSENNTIENSTILDNDVGIYVCGSNNTIGNSSIRDNKIGIRVNRNSEDEPSNNSQIYYNNICGNDEYGVDAGENNKEVDATCNWWGDENGPGGEGDGDGDAVTINVIFDPWLTEAAFNIKPDVTITGPGEGEEICGSCTIRGTAEDEDGDVRSVDIKIDDGNWEDAVGTTSWRYEWDTTGVSNGEHTIHARAFDGEDYSYVEEVTVIVENENIKPTVSITEPEDGGEISGTYEIKGTANDEDGEIRKVEIRIGNDDWVEVAGKNSWAFDWETTEVPDAEHTIYARAFDGEEYSDVHELTITVKNKNEKPVVTITEPDEEEEISGSYTIEGTTSDEDGEVQKVEVKINDGDWEDAEGTTSWQFDWDTTKAEDGEHTISVRAFDGKNHSEIVSVIVTVHNEKQVNHSPTIEVASVEKTDDYTYQIAWAASDPDEDVLEIDLYYDTDTNPENGKTLIIEDLDDTGSFDWDISGMEDGDYYILAVAWDGKGGETGNYSGRFTISLPELAPDFAVVSLDIPPPTPRPGDTVLIRIIVKNEGTASGTGTVEFLVDGVQLESKSLTLQPGREKTLSSVWSAVEGNHTVSVRVSVLGDSDLGNNEVERVVNVAGAQEGKEKGDDDDFPVVYVGSALATVVVICALVGGVVYRKKGEDAGEVVARCPGCGGETQYSREEEDYYCWECEEYVGEMDDEMDEEEEVIE